MNYSEWESYISGTGILLWALSAAKTAASGNAAIGTKTSTYIPTSVTARASAYPKTETSETKWVAGVKGTAMKAGTTTGGISAGARSEHSNNWLG